MLGAIFWGGVQGKEVLTDLPGIDLTFPEKARIFFPPPLRHGCLISFCLGDNSFIWNFLSLTEDMINAVHICCVCVCEGSPVLCDGVRKWRGLDVPYSEVASLR